MTTYMKTIKTFIPLSALAFLAAILAVSCSQTPNRQPLERSVVYELNVRQYTPEGTFAAAQGQLPRLKDTGVDIIWLMPIYPCPVRLTFTLSIPLTFAFSLMAITLSGLEAKYSRS